MTVTPSAYAIAHVLTKPVRRETSVETDIDAVDRAMEGLAMGDSLRSAVGTSVSHP